MTWLVKPTECQSIGVAPLAYLIGTAIFGLLLVVLVWAADSGRAHSNPGSTGRRSSPRRLRERRSADFADSLARIGYPGGSLLLLACVLLSLLAGIAVSARVESTRLKLRVRSFYWITITFSQTLGTALGETGLQMAGLGYSAVRWCSALGCAAGDPLFRDDG